MSVNDLQPGSHTSAGFPPTSTISVLIIDDEIEQYDPLVKLLSLEGFHIESAGTGAEGVARALATTWQIILLDLHLPDVLGITVLSELRGHGLRCPVLVTTGWYLDSGHQEAAAALGAVGFVRKPLFSETLGKMLRTAVAAESAAAPGQQSEINGTPPPGQKLLGERRNAGATREDCVVRSLYVRAAAGDRLALDDLCQRMLKPLEQSVGRMRRAAQRDWVHDAVQDALLDFRANMTHFDPARGNSLTSFLRMAAHRNLLNRVDAERRRLARERTDRPAGEPRLASMMPTYERQLDIERAVRAIRGGLSPVEDAVFALILDGEYRTDILAGAAGIGDLPAAERTKGTRRITNRIFQRLRRLRTPG